MNCDFDNSKKHSFSMPPKLRWCLVGKNWWMVLNGWKSCYLPFTQHLEPFIL